MRRAAMVAYNVDQGRIEVGDQEIQVIGRQVAAAHDQVDFWQPAPHRVIIELRLHVVGNGQ